MQFPIPGGEAFRSRRVAGSLAVALGSAASLVSAMPAQAGTFVVDHANASAAYQALPGEANQVALVLQNKLKLQDKGLASIGFVEIGSISCLLNEPYKWECPARSVTSADIALGDGTDRYEDVGTSIPTTVRGGTGGKRVITGAGNDQISLRNGWGDRITCGAGTDVVTADAGDEVDSTCEIVDRAQSAGGSGPIGGGTSGPSGSADPGSTDSDGTDSPDGWSDSADGDSTPEDGSTTEDGALGAALGLTLPLESIAVPRRTVAVVPLGCEVTTEGGCRGEVILDLARPSRRAATANRVMAARGRHTRQQRRRARRLGKQSFVLAPGESVKLPVAIVLRGHHSIMSRRRRRPKAILTVVHRDASGKATGVETRTVTLQLERRKWARRNRRSR